MALTPSTMLPLGTKASDFELFDVISNHMLSLNQLKSNIATVIMFICNHCPYVKHVQEQLVQLAVDYQAKGISFIAINSNDASQYPDDAPDKMKLTAEQFNYPFPYLYDESQEVARAYQAACTPDFYVFDGQLSCVYRGQLDASRPGNSIPVTGIDVREALNAILSQQPIKQEQIPSMGCNIKWKKI